MILVVGPVGGEGGVNIPNFSLTYVHNPGKLQVSRGRAGIVQNSQKSGTDQGWPEPIVLIII